MQFPLEAQTEGVPRRIRRKMNFPASQELEREVERGHMATEADTMDADRPPQLCDEATVVSAVGTPTAQEGRPLPAERAPTPPWARAQQGKQPKAPKGRGAVASSALDPPTTSQGPQRGNRSGRGAARTRSAADMEWRLERVERSMNMLTKVLLRVEEEQRDLVHWSQRTFIFPPQHPLGQSLLRRMQIWKGRCPPRGAHPDGPPRRAITMELVRWGLEREGDLETLVDWANFHRAMEHPQELDSRSIQRATARMTYDGRTLLTLRAWPTAAEIWQDFGAILDEELRKCNVEQISEAAPPGPLVRRLRESTA